MSKCELTERLMTDPSFVDSVYSAPSSVLETYDVPDGLIEALETGDESRIRSTLGLDLGAGVPNQGPVDHT